MDAWNAIVQTEPLNVFKCKSTSFIALVISTGILGLRDPFADLATVTSINGANGEKQP